jgi:amino acid transporter
MLALMPVLLLQWFQAAPDTMATRGLHTPRYQMWQMLLEAVQLVPWHGYGWLQVGAAELAVVDRHPPIGELWLQGHNIFVELVVWCGWPLGLALGAALVFCVASFVGFESAAIYSEEVKDPKRTVARATFIAVAITGVFYALSSWLLANSVGPDVITNPDALVEGGFTTAGGPDPTTVLFIAGQDRLGAFWGDSASLLFCTSLFAALLSFHNSVARYFFAHGRERVLPAAVGRTSARTGAPIVGSLVQSAAALLVVGAFAVAGADPVIKLFTWLGQLGALGVLVLMTITSFAVVAFFRRRPDRDAGPLRTFVAPLIAGVLMLVIAVLAVTNFNVLITSAPDAPLTTAAVVLPLLLLVAGVIGVIVAATIRSRDPQRYARIGNRTAVEVAEEVA